jgi:hypothetical protein
MQNDPTYEIRNAIKTALDGNLSYLGRKYGVMLYEKLQKGDYYVRIKYPSLIDNSETKDSYLMIGNIDIEVVNQRYMSQNTSEVEMVDIVNDINQLIVHQNLSMTGFVFCVQPFVTSYNTQEELMQNEQSEIKKIINYQFIIQQS